MTGPFLQPRHDPLEARAAGVLFALDLTIRLAEDWDEPRLWQIEDRNAHVAVDFETLSEAMEWLMTACVHAEAAHGTAKEGER